MEIEEELKVRLSQQYLPKKIKKSKFIFYLLQLLALSENMTDQVRNEFELCNLLHYY